jgi:hypothetical protein
MYINFIKKSSNLPMALNICIEVSTLSTNSTNCLTVYNYNKLPNRL